MSRIGVASRVYAEPAQPIPYGQLDSYLSARPGGRQSMAAPTEAAPEAPVAPAAPESPPPPPPPPSSSPN